MNSDAPIPMTVESLRKLIMLIGKFLDNYPDVDERSHIRLIDFGCTHDFYEDIMSSTIDKLYRPELEVAFNGTFTSVRASMRFIYTFYSTLLKGTGFCHKPKLYVMTNQADSGDHFNLYHLAYSWKVDYRSVYDALLVSEGKSPVKNPKESDSIIYREAHNNAMFLSALLTDFKGSIFDDVERMFGSKFSKYIMLENKMKSDLNFRKFQFQIRTEFPEVQIRLHLVL